MGLNNYTWWYYNLKIIKIVRNYLLEKMKCNKIEKYVFTYLKLQYSNQKIQIKIRTKTKTKSIIYIKNTIAITIIKC